MPKNPINPIIDPIGGGAAILLEAAVTGIQAIIEQATAEHRNTPTEGRFNGNTPINHTRQAAAQSTGNGWAALYFAISDAFNADTPTPETSTTPIKTFVSKPKAEEPRSENELTPDATADATAELTAPAHKIKIA